ncbi:eukaryotic translation initiation factor 3 subunit A [Vigna umbellata]|uniref:eukaryotic translation initiation factor 3 subunit A n=1 Tax=Vigna umbellata TaxID=87088 RepID=UPI001F5E7064|nr:eukaryotic translation initiation factor 3 subunit A [Vigna umbellata]
MAKEKQQQQEEDYHKMLRSYLGLSFSMFLATLANNSVPALQGKVRMLSLRAVEAAEELRQMKSRRQEDSKANARVVEIFASHRNAWQAEEKRLLQQIEAAAEEIARLRGRVAELEDCVARAEKEVGERDEMIGFMSRRIEEEGLVHTTKTTNAITLLLLLFPYEQRLLTETKSKRKTQALVAMAKEKQQQQEEDYHKMLRSYLGLSFSMFLATLENNSVQALQGKVRMLSLRAVEAAEELRQMKSRRQEDSKANARVVEIFASHRNAWQAEEKRLLQQIEAAAEEIARLRGRVAELEDCVARAEKEVGERDEMIGFMSRRIEEEGLGGGEHYGKKSGEWFQKEVEEEELVGSTRSLEEEVEVIYEQHSQHFGNNGFDSEFMASASKFWAEKASLWQDVQYESLESMYNTKHFVARRESPWKVDGDSAGVSSKLKLLEQDLLNLEKNGKNDPSKASSLIKKQAKRYQGLSEKIDDLCRRIANDPCEPSLSSEFRTQTQTEFLLEAFRLQQGVSETGQNLMALQTEIGKNNYREELRNETTLTTRRSLDSMRNNFKDIQRNLEIWLARIIGDLEGILSREGASRVREYYISRYPFVQ